MSASSYDLIRYATPSVVPEARDHQGPETSLDVDAVSTPTVPDGPPIPGGFSAVPRTRARDSTSHLSLEHLLCHFPTLPNCPVCQRAKHTRLPARRRLKHIRARRETTAFGDLVVGDFIIERSSYLKELGAIDPALIDIATSGDFGRDDMLRDLENSAEDYPELLTLAAALRGKPAALVLHDIHKDRVR